MYRRNKQHGEKTNLKFTNIEIPVDFVNPLSKSLDNKNLHRKVSNLDIITGVERLATSCVINQANYIRIRRKG